MSPTPLNQSEVQKIRLINYYWSKLKNSKL